jgi:hypothetical protein
MKQNFSFLSDIDTKIPNEKNKIKVEILQDEISGLVKLISGKRRKTFLSTFDNLLTLKLQKNGIKCWLKCRSNWFSKEGGNNAHAWKGSFNCVSEKCDILYEAVINESIRINTNVCIDVTWCGLANHDKIIKNIRCSGSTRFAVAMESIAKGVANYQIDQKLDENRESKSKFDLKFILAFI